MEAAPATATACAPGMDSIPVLDLVVDMNVLHWPPSDGEGMTVVVDMPSTTPPSKPRRDDGSSPPCRKKKAPMSAEELQRKKQASIEMRRKRNRESMQRARERERHQMEELRAHAQALEETYTHLLENKRSAVSACHSLLPFQDAARYSELWTRLEEARSESKQMMAQNLTLQSAIVDRIKGEDRVEGLLRELLREQQLLLESASFDRDLLVNDANFLRCISERQVVDLILDSRSGQRFVDKLGFDSNDSIRMELFGWDTHRRAMGQYLHISSTKLFRNHRALDVMTRTWNNEMRFVSYRNAKQAASQRQHFMRKYNDDAYMFARDSPDPEGNVVRMGYVRFRLHEPDDTYVVATQSVKPELCTFVANPHKHRVWAHELCQWQFFKPVIEQVMGDDGVEQLVEHCEVRVMGRIAFGDLSNSDRNALETILGLLRWENINIGPMLTLTQSLDGGD
ncbi:TPA: hypothetical protein N0F65_003325 [Lagenidium giganteum]|uniref:BZIP domain-containing protein n=1 Tax=Lagenidium giganteum TaxID=4803 RepID=A0AAV2ZD19_9STRA|nr:TPA: hypothetical protein N0F65_003325 [Lagenidium giganteum]